MRIWVIISISITCDASSSSTNNWTGGVEIFPLLYPKRHLLQKTCQNPCQAPRLVIGRVFSQQQNVCLDTARLWFQSLAGSYQRLWKWYPVTPAWHSIFGVQFWGALDHPMSPGTAATWLLQGIGQIQRKSKFHTLQDVTNIHWDLNLTQLSSAFWKCLSDQVWLFLVKISFFPS